MRAHFDTRQVKRLQVDLETQPAKKLPEFRRVVRDSAGAMVILWKREARESNPGGHAKHYIPALSYELTDGGLTAHVGPYMDRSTVGRQGFMAFEYGDHNHPPQLNGNRAADRVFPAFRKRALDVAEPDL